MHCPCHGASDPPHLPSVSICELRKTTTNREKMSCQRVHRNVIGYLLVTVVVCITDQATATECSTKWKERMESYDVDGNCKTALSGSRNWLKDALIDNKWPTTNVGHVLIPTDECVRPCVKMLTALINAPSAMVICQPRGSTFNFRQAIEKQSEICARCTATDIVLPTKCTTTHKTLILQELGLSTYMPKGIDNTELCSTASGNACLAAVEKTSTITSRTCTLKNGSPDKLLRCTCTVNWSNAVYAAKTKKDCLSDLANVSHHWLKKAISSTWPSTANGVDTSNGACCATSCAKLITDILNDPKAAICSRSGANAFDFRTALIAQYEVCKNQIYCTAKQKPKKFL